jgi:hypothetical protein
MAADNREDEITRMKKERESGRAGERESGRKIFKFSNLRF